jgi:glucose uptake protein
MSPKFDELEPGKLGPYSALFCFAAGLLLSNFVINPTLMRWPLHGTRLAAADYFRGTARDHLFGLLGGAIWALGMTLSIIAAGQAGFAISYGLGQGATLVAALWGVFIWKEFRDAPSPAGRLLGLMFAGYFLGLGLIIAARVA